MPFHMVNSPIFLFFIMHLEIAYFDLVLTMTWCFQNI